MLHAVIMAGGAGTRFWPESRADRPKQLLDLLGGRTMIQATVDRLAGLVPPERLLIVTNRRLVAAIAEQIPGLPPTAVIGEPCKRDTAPCIGLAALAISRDDPHATMVVLPADHVIRPVEAFQSAIRTAAALVDQQPHRIVTFGIPPTYPATSFGYVERGYPLSSQASGRASTFLVERFREKPALALAKEFVASGRFYWNAGIFVWRARTILEALAQQQPEMYAHLERIAAASGQPGFDQVFEREFAAIQGISVDYAVLEQASDVVVIEAPFEWDDVGSWQALARLRGADADGNTVAARHLGLRTTNTIVRGGSDHLIVTLGLTDCLIVHTPDATLVANKHDEEAVKELVRLIREHGWEEYL